MCLYRRGGAHGLLCIEMITRTLVYHPRPRIWVVGLIKNESARRVREWPDATIGKV